MDQSEPQHDVDRHAAQYAVGARGLNIGTACGTRARGMVVALLGPDGSGKSSVLGALRDRLASSFTSIRVFHFRPHFGHVADDVPGSVYADPHSQAPRGTVVSLLKLVYYWCDYVVGVGRLRRSRKDGGVRLELFDRYVYDVEADPRRYRYGGPRWALRLLSRVTPRPDLVIVLTGDPVVIGRRKNEVESSELARLCTAYGEMGRRSGWVVLDATEPLALVVTRAEEAVLAQRSRRGCRRVWCPWT